ncbi:MAG: TetR/AcrR family transcriptional regulator [Clostridiales bacterium]|nr:TetR/AcrR family transcriptional regulator [Clostridiales bacterium]
MSDTKENILITALSLFAEDGYEAVSVSMIAGALGMTKGALYKHYKNKRDIFDSIIERMNQMDYDRAKAYEMPEGTMDEDADAYHSTSLETIRIYSKAQFRYWTEEEFPSNFRKMLTLEQYRNPEMAQLYQQYLANGPLMYMADIFTEFTGSKSDAMQAALAFYGPFFLLYNVYDSTEDKAKVVETADQYIDSFITRLNQTTEKGRN